MISLAITRFKCDILLYMYILLGPIDGFHSRDLQSCGTHMTKAMTATDVGAHNKRSSLKIILLVCTNMAAMT